MRLLKARVQNYRSIKDSGWFNVENSKTIFVGPNEAGKTAILQALQQLNPPSGIPGFDPLRDYPRAEFNDITTKKVNPDQTEVVEGHFLIEPEDLDEIPTGFEDAIYVYGKRLNNSMWHRIENGKPVATFKDIKKDLIRLKSHIDSRAPKTNEENATINLPSSELDVVIKDWLDNTLLDSEKSSKIICWLEKNLSLVEEDSAEEQKYDKLIDILNIANTRQNILSSLEKKLPIFVLFNNYFRVKPIIHLEHLAQRLENNTLDDEQYDYGNQCLLKLLGFSARQLSDLGKAQDPNQKDSVALQKYRDQLDTRTYQLNAASVRLTNEIRIIWVPDAKRSEADKLRIQADGQYLKVVVEDDLGVEIELHQRSEGFQWLVSFFIVFFAEALDKHENAILLLDEPGLSLHGLKQREFRKTISRLAESNQTIYTTHSPFLVGPDELDLVRVVEMTDRKIGTKVVTSLNVGDPASLLPLQEALGYDLAQSLFSQQKNLVLEGLTDYWYLEAMAQMLRDSGIVSLSEKIALIPAASAGKVVYYATILHAQKLKVVALLDSDNAGDQAAKQENLVNALGNKNILRTKDFYTGTVSKPEIEDLIKDTLIQIAKNDLSWDILTESIQQPNRPLVDIFSSKFADFSKYKLSKAFLKWSRNHTSNDLTANEVEQWKNLMNKINNSLK